MRLLSLLLFTFSCYADIGPFLITNDTLHSGFGAEFSAVLGSLDYYEQGHYAGLKIDYNSGCYLDPAPAGPNWWNYYFEPILLGDEEHEEHYHFTQSETIDLSQKAFRTPRERNFELIQKYIRVKPKIKKAVDRYAKTYFAGHYVIGVHYRGTDKALETPLIPYTYFIIQISNIMNQLSKSDKSKVRIFVATDDQNFLEYLLDMYGKYVIFNDFVRSSDGKPLHYGPTPYESNYERGRDALIDALLLSKTQVLIRPAPSAFSWMSMNFNPTLPVHSL